KDHQGQAGAIPPLPKENPIGPAAAMRLEPAEVTLLPGEKAQFKARLVDANGRVVKTVDDGQWSLPVPPPPPRTKINPPTPKGKIKDGLLVADAQVANQEGVVFFQAGAKFRASARVRVAPRLPYAENFDKVTPGLVPGGWVNAQGKFTVAVLKDGS